MTYLSVDPEIDRLLQTQLEEGEVLLWANHPSSSRFAARAMPTALTGIGFTVFAGVLALGALGFRWRTMWDASALPAVAALGSLIAMGFGLILMSCGIACGTLSSFQSRPVASWPAAAY